jgi:hypothetical protein
MEYVERDRAQDTARVMFWEMISVYFLSVVKSRRRESVSKWHRVCASATSWRLGSQPHDVLAREYASPQHVMVVLVMDVH